MVPSHLWPVFQCLLSLLHWAENQLFGNWLRRRWGAPALWVELKAEFLKPDLIQCHMVIQQVDYSISWRVSSACWYCILAIWWLQKSKVRLQSSLLFLLASEWHQCHVGYFKHCWPGIVQCWAQSRLGYLVYKVTIWSRACSHLVCV